MTTFVLVHGAWHGAWCWYKIVARLQRAGHQAIAVDLPGHGIDRTPLAEETLDLYAARVVKELDAAPDPVVLVGHSMGGLVIGPAAEARPDRVRALVYLTALMPQPGKSGVETRLAFGAPPTNSAADPTPDGLALILRRDSGRDRFYNDCDDEDVALAMTALVPQALAPMTAPLELTPANYGRVRRVYIECLRDHAIQIEHQRIMQAAMPCERVFTLDTSHSPFFSAPDKLTGILVGL